MKHVVIAGLILVSGSAFSAERVALSAGGTITIQGLNTNVEISCQSKKELPLCTIYCEEAQTMARQCANYHVRIDGVTASKFNGYNGDLDAAKREIVNLKQLGVCK